jgi:hypothetical protein
VEISVKLTIAKIVSLMSMLALASCSSAGKPTPEPSTVAPSATSVPVFATPAPTAEPEPLPTGYTDFLQEKVDSGEWTLETGLVTMLSLFAGEIPASQAGLGPGVLETEGTGLLQMAGGYLQTGTDQATKDELTRLINLLVPTQEELDRYSIPVKQASARGPGLAAPARQEDEDCSLLWPRGFPDEPTESYPCYLFDGYTVASSSSRVYLPLAWRGDPSRQSYYAATMEAIQDTVAFYTSFFGEAGNIYFVFSTLESAGLDYTILADYRSFDKYSEACPVIIYPGALTSLTLPAFKQRIAHEIFHCFQAWNVTDQLIEPGGSQEWWSEGTAEYFSNLVYPKVDYEHRLNESFSRLSTTFPLTSMSSENSTFFQFMGNAIGPEGVIAMMENMPTTPGDKAQLEALAAYPGIDGYFEQFVRAVMDNTLMDSGGPPVPIPVNYTAEYLFFDTVSKVFSSQRPFVASRYRVSFAGEKEYSLEWVSGYSSAPGAAGNMDVRFANTPGVWDGNVSDTVGGCDQLDYLMYVITTAPGTYERTETISTNGVIETPCDRCLIGNWEATNESMKAYMQSAGVAGEAAGPVIRSIKGRMYLEFYGNGTGLSGYDQLEVHESGAGDIEDVDVFVNLDGTSSGRYRADGSELIALPGETDIRVVVEIFLNAKSLGASEDPLDPEDLPFRPGYPTRYTCEGDTLSTWPPVEGVTVEPILWIRAGP